MADDPLSQAAASIERVTENLGRVGELIVHGGGSGRSGPPSRQAGMDGLAHSGGPLAVANIRSTNFAGQGSVVNITTANVLNAGGGLPGNRGPTVRVAGANWNAGTGTGGGSGNQGAGGAPAVPFPPTMGTHVPVVRVVGATWNAPGGGGGGVGGSGPPGTPATPGGGQDSNLQPNILQRFNQGMMDSINGFRRFNSIMGELVNSLLSGAAKASPSHVATLTGSMDMLQSRLGRVLLPLIENMSLSIQRFTAFLDTPVMRRSINAGGAALGWTWNNLSAASIPGWWRSGVSGSFNMWRRFRGEDSTPDMDTTFKHIREKGSWWQQQLVAMFDATGAPLKKSLQGMPQAKITDAASYYDAIQMASLNLSADETAVDVMKEQLKNLESLGGLLKEISDNTSHIRNIQPAFR